MEKKSALFFLHIVLTLGFYSAIVYNELFITFFHPYLLPHLGILKDNHYNIIKQIYLVDRHPTVKLQNESMSP